MFSKKLHEITFFDIYNLNFERIFHSISLHYNLKSSITFKDLFALIITPLYHIPLKASIKRNKDSKILFFLSPIQRISYYQTFLKIYGTIEKRDIVTFPISQRRKFDILSALKYYFFYFPVWFFQLRYRSVSLFEKLIIIEKLFYLHHIQVNTLSKLNVKDYNLLVVMFDFYTIDSFVVEYFKSIGIKTCTLQHGQFTRKRNVENSIENSGIEFDASFSDYMLCWNRFTKNEAAIQGVNLDKLVILGIPTFIGINDKWLSPNSNIFGVILSHSSYQNENPYLIKAANLLAKAFGLKYSIRYHPNFAGNEYDLIIDKSVCIGNSKKGLNLKWYADEVDFSLIASSSVFTELIYLKHPTIRYSSKLENDKFRDIKIGSVFHLEEEIISCYNGFPNMNDLEDLFNEMCTIEDVAFEYNKFFKRFQ